MLKRSLILALILVICLSFSAASAADMDDDIVSDYNSDFALNSNSDLTDVELSDNLDNSDLCLNSNSDLTDVELSDNLDNSNIGLSDNLDNSSENKEKINDEQQCYDSDVLSDSTGSDIYVSEIIGDDSTGDGTEANPYKTIYNALSNLPSSSSVNIRLASGTYHITDNINLNQRNNINIIGQEYNRTFLDAGNNGFFFKIGESSAVSFENISFINFYLQDYCMFNNTGKLSLNRCIVRSENYSYARNFDVSPIVNNGTLVIRESKFFGNGNATIGTLIYNVNGSINIDGSEFSNYSIGGYFSHFIAIRSEGEINVSNSNFTNISPSQYRDCCLIYAQFANISFINSSVSNAGFTYAIYTHMLGDLVASNNKFSNVSISNALFLNWGDSLISENSFSNITSVGTRYIMLIRSINGDNNVYGNNFTDIRGRFNSLLSLQGANYIVNNRFDGIAFEENASSSGNSQPCVIYVADQGAHEEYETFLQNNSIEASGYYVPIYLYIYSYTDYKVNLNVTCLNGTLNNADDYYEVQVTDDMGNGISTSPYTPLLSLYSDGEEMASSNVTNGTAYMKFTIALENREYEVIPYASFLSSRSNVQGATLLVDLRKESYELYVSDSEGNDESGNGTIENPFKSLRKAFEGISSQDVVTIHLASGNYSGEDNQNISARLDNSIYGGKISIIGEDMESTFIYSNETVFLLSNYTSLALLNLTLFSSINKGGGIVTLENCRLENISSNSRNITIVNSTGSISYMYSSYAYIYDSEVFSIENRQSWIRSTYVLAIDNSSLCNVTGNRILSSNNTFLSNSSFYNFTSNDCPIYATNISVVNCSFDTIYLNNMNSPNANIALVYAMGDIDFINSTVSNCSSFMGRYTSLIYGDGSVTSFRVLDSQFMECENVLAVHGRYMRSEVLIDNCSFMNYRNTESWIGIIYLRSNSTVSNCSFINSSHMTSGVVCLTGSESQDVFFTIVNNVFNNSYAVNSSYGSSFCIHQYMGTSFLQNNTIIAEDENVCIIDFQENVNYNQLCKSNVHASFINQTINGGNVHLYINITDDMGNPVTSNFYNYHTQQTRNVSFILSGDLIGYAPVINGVATLDLPGMLANGVYEFTGEIPFASDEAVIQFTDVIVNFDFGKTTVYVSADGSDEEGDGSLENPFKTIEKAIRYGLNQTTDVEVYIRQGVYSGLGNVDLTLDYVGILSLIGYDGFNKTIIDGENTDKFLNVSSRSNLHLLNLSFVNAHLDSQIANSSAIYSLGNLSIASCVFDGLDANETVSMIYTANDMSLVDSVFINGDDTLNPAICIDGGESYLKNNTMTSFEGVNGSIYMKSGLLNVVLMYMGNSTFNVGGPKMDLRASVTDDMGNSIYGGTVSFIINDTSYGNVSVNRGYSSIYSNNNLQIGQYRLYGDYSFASQGSSLNGIAFTVNPIHDPVSIYVSAEGDDLRGDGSPENPFKTINKSINFGYSKTYNIEIFLREGVYSGLENINFNLDSDLSFIGIDGFNKTIIDGYAPDEWNSRFFDISNRSNVKLVNLTFVNTYHITNSATYRPIRNSGNLSIIDCVFENHIRDQMELIFNNGILFINNTIFNNFSSSSSSIASYSTGGVISTSIGSILEVYNSKFYNSKDMDMGGAIYGYHPGRVDIVSCEFINCSANWGGAIFMYGNTNVSVIGNYFEKCTARNGGAIYTDYVYLENNVMVDCNKTRSPIYADYTNAYLNFEDIYTHLRTGFSAVIYLCDDNGNRISTSSNNKVSLIIDGETVSSSISMGDGLVRQSISKIFNNGTYLIGGEISNIDAGYYDVTVNWGTLIVELGYEYPITVYVDNANGDDTGIGSFENPFKTLSRAVEFAFAQSNYPTIVIQSGTYTGADLGIVMENVENLTLQGNGAIFDGEGRNSAFRFNNISNLNVQGIKFINTKSDSYGSAIIVNDTDFAMISNCRFEGDDAPVSVNNSGSITLQYSDFKNGNGVAVFANNTESVNIRSSSFENNNASEGGLVFIEGEALLNHLQFVSNSAKADGLIRFKGNVTVNNTIFDNTSSSEGNIILFSGNYSGESNFWGRNYYSIDEFIQANLLMKETDGIRESVAPENWVVVDSNVLTSIFANTTRDFEIFFCHYNDSEIVDSLGDYWLLINSLGGNCPDEQVALWDGTGKTFIFYDSTKGNDDKLSISTLNGIVLREYDISFKDYELLDVVYVSIDGNDDGDGSYDHPFRALEIGFKCLRENGNLFIHGNYNGGIVIDRNMTISSYDGEAILNGWNGLQIMEIGKGLNVTLDGLSFIDGAGKYGAISAGQYGSLSGYSNLIIRNSNFIHSHGSYQGSSFAMNLNGNIIFENVSFINGLGTIFFGGNISFIDSSFINNSMGANGCLMYPYDNTRTILMENCRFINNSYGQGIFAENYNRLVDIMIYDSIFENNHGNSAGGIFYGPMNLELEGCTFINNSAYYSGGVAHLRGGNLVIEDCLFANNSASYGGAICAEDGDTNVYVSHSIFLNNLARDHGGGAIRANDLTVEHSIFEGNIAPNATAISYSNFIDASNNYWGRNFESAEEFIDEGLIAYHYISVEYFNKAPENWIILTLSDDSVDWMSSKEIEVSLAHLSDGTELEYEFLPDYTVFINDSLGNVVPCEVLISGGSGTFTFDASNRYRDTVYIYSTLTEDNLLLAKDILVAVYTNTSMTVPESVGFGEAIPISVKVEAMDGSVVDGNVSILIDGEKLIDLALINGAIDYNLTLNRAGSFEVTAIFNSDNYVSSSDSANVTVNRIGSKLCIKNYYILAGESVVMDIGLYDEDGNPLSGTVTLKFGAETVEIEIDGNARYDLGTFDEIGINEVFAEYLGNDTYEYANASSKIVVYGPGNVTVKHTDAGDAADIQAAIDAANPGDIIRLGDYDYVNVSDVNISKNLTISGDGASITSTGDGTPIFNVPAISEGGPESVAITGVDFKLSNGDIVVKATADNDTEDPLSIVTPDIRINGNAFELINETTVAESITVLELDSERGILAPTGEISISGNSIAAGVNPFDFEVTSIGTGDNINISPQNLTVEKKATVIHYEDMNTTTVDQSVDGRSGKYFNFQLTDTEGNPIVGVPMQIGFLGVIYDESNGIITNETGGARLQINLGYKNDYTFAICFLGNDEYNGSFVIAKIIVTPQKGSLTVPNKSYSASAKTKTLTATFKSASGKPVSGKKITFTVNGKTYYAKTNDKGVASVNVSLSKKGTYSFTAKFATNGMYETMTKTAKLTIK